MACSPAPTPCSPRRSSTSASTRSARPRRTSPRAASQSEVDTAIRDVNDAVTAVDLRRPSAKVGGAAEPTFDERGLVPCVVQDADRGTVLMLAWMNAEALRLTRETGIVHFWSRSRQALWKKGETSGNTLALVELRVDCDRDALLARVRPAGPACHTGAPTCFFDRDDGTDRRRHRRGHDPRAPRSILAARRDSATAEKSYTKSLLDAGMPKILAKIAEEHGELAAELPAGPDDKVDPRDRRSAVPRDGRAHRARDPDRERSRPSSRAASARAVTSRRRLARSDDLLAPGGALAARDPALRGSRRAARDVGRGRARARRSARR